MMLEASRLSIRFGGLAAVDDVSLHVAEGKIVAREALSEAVARGEGDLRSVDALISRLRRKLAGGDGATVIATAPGFGYRLAAPVRREG